MCSEHDAHKLGLLFLLALLAAANRLESATKTSNLAEGGTGEWEANATWNPAGRPTAEDDVIIKSGNTVTISPNATTPGQPPQPIHTGGMIRIKSLTIRGNATLTTKNVEEKLVIGLINGGLTIDPVGTLSTKDATQNGQNSGSLDIRAAACGHGINNCGIITTGKGGPGALGGGNGGNSGDLIIQGTSQPARLENNFFKFLTNDGTIKTGDGGAGNGITKSGGKSGNLEIYITDEFNNTGSGKIQTGEGGQGSNVGPPDTGNGGDSGKVGDLTLRVRENFRNAGTIKTPDGRAGGTGRGASPIKGGKGSNAGFIKVHGFGGADVAIKKADLSKNVMGGKPGAKGSGINGADPGTEGEKAEGSVNASEKITLGPGSRFTGGLCTLDFGAGTLILSGIETGTIVAEGTVDFIGCGTIDLSNAQPDAIQSTGGDSITFHIVNEDVQFVPAVNLDDLTSPDAFVDEGLAETVCPPESPSPIDFSVCPIPTLSHWGMITLVLLLLTMGKVLFARRTTV